MVTKLWIVIVPLLLLALIIGTIGCGGDGKDTDGDGWTDAQEQSAGTDIYEVDTDGDGYWDPQDPNPLDLSIPTAGDASTPTITTTPEITSKPTGISWDEANYHIGDRTTVYGPVIGTYWASGSNGKPTFLNIGRDYPDSARFAVVIWIQNRANFPQTPESYYYGKNICVTGLITEYQGVAQIEVSTPSQIQEY